MRIAIDAMGGDDAPRALIEGSVSVCRDGTYSGELVLIGHETRLREALDSLEKTFPIEIVHAPDIIGMGEAGPLAIRKKRDASLSTAMRLLAEDKVDAVVSAGNSGATVATARHFVGLIPGLRRPALAVPIPTPYGEVLLADVGANAEATAIQLAQSAILAHAYLKVTGGFHRPRVGLLNIGEEPIKGTEVIRRAFTLLERSSLHFVGNIEPRDVFANKTNAVICDGFTGNIFLKLFETLSENFFEFWKAGIEENVTDPEKRTVEKFSRLQKNYCYRRVGGAPLLGVRKTVVAAHGRSDASAVSNAIHLAARFVEAGTFGRISEELEQDSLLAELKLYHPQRILDHWKNNWTLTPTKT